MNNYQNCYFVNLFWLNNLQWTMSASIKITFFVLNYGKSNYKLVT